MHGRKRCNHAIHLHHTPLTLDEVARFRNAVISRLTEAETVSLTISETCSVPVAAKELSIDGVHLRVPTHSGPFRDCLAKLAPHASTSQAASPPSCLTCTWTGSTTLPHRHAGSDFDRKNRTGRQNSYFFLFSSLSRRFSSSISVSAASFCRRSSSFC